MVLRNFCLGQDTVCVKTEKPLLSVARITFLVSDFVILLIIAFLNADAAAVTALLCVQVYIPCVYCSCSLEVKQQAGVQNEVKVSNESLQ